MAFDTGGYAYGAKTIGATAAVISDGTSRRKSLFIQNLHASNSLYVGPDSSVTTSNGIRLQSGDSLEFSDFLGAIYGIADGAGTDVRYVETG